MSRILFLSRWFPSPCNNGSKLRVHSLLSALCRRHDVFLLSFREPGEDESQASDLHAMCRTVRSIPRVRRASRGLDFAAKLCSSTPRSHLESFSAEMASAASETIEKESIDCVIASQIDTAAYRNFLDDVPCIFEELELGLTYEAWSGGASVAARVRGGLTWFKHRRFVGRLLRRFDAVTVASERERDLAQRFLAHLPPVEIVPNCLDLSRYPNTVESRDKSTLIFSGPLAYEPNRQAVVWFQEHVRPILAARIPDVHAIVTGKRPASPLPNVEGLTLTGYVDDVKPLTARSACCIVPLQSGGGTRLKILEAMALHTPVVSTSKGVEGLAVEHGEHVLIGDDPETFAAAVADVLSSSDLAAHLAANAYDLVRKRYDSSVASGRLLDLVEQVAGPDARKSSPAGSISYHPAGSAPADSVH